MKKQIAIEIDGSTWNSGIPSAISKLPKKWSFDLGLALAHLALRSRPPGIHGFDLSDTWAILRYGYAFTTGLKFILRPEWIDTDPHQKTILSDDFGVGLTTYLLADKLGAVNFYDCKHFMKYFPNFLSTVNKGKKNGEFKTPDFIFTDGRGQLSLVECKGTQSSHYQLGKAMSRGLDQKSNVASGTRKLKHSLVMGAFIPQYNSKQYAKIQIIDPSWDDYSRFLVELKATELSKAMVMYDLAKDMSLLNMPLLSRQFSSKTVTEPIQTTSKIRNEIENSINRPTEFKQSFKLDTQGVEDTPRSISVEVEDNGGIRERVSSILDANINEFVDTEITLRSNRKWSSTVENGTSMLTSPTGLSIKIIIED